MYIFLINIILIIIIFIIFLIENIFNVNFKMYISKCTLGGKISI